MVPRKQAGHMTCTRPQAERQILLAMRASSTHDPQLTSAHSVEAGNSLRYELSGHWFEQIVRERLIQIKQEFRRGRSLSAGAGGRALARRIAIQASGRSAV
jgi:hypothetical protein